MTDIKYPAVLPWGKPDTIYQDDGPKEEIEFVYCGHAVKVTPTNKHGVHSGRTRYHVKCLTCMKLIHEATTGPRSLLEQHVRETFGWEHAQQRAIDAYHEHLDVCEQCEQHPFNQCPEGMKLLIAAGRAAQELLKGGL